MGTKKLSKKNSATLVAGIIGGMTAAYGLSKGVQWLDREAQHFPLPVGRAMDIAVNVYSKSMDKRDYRDLFRIIPPSTVPRDDLWYKS